MSSCPTCGSDDREADTFRHRLDCLRDRAAELGAFPLVDRVEMLNDWVHVAQSAALGLPDSLDDEVQGLVDADRD